MQDNLEIKIFNYLVKRFSQIDTTEIIEWKVKKFCDMFEIINRVSKWCIEEVVSPITWKMFVDRWVKIADEDID